MTAPVIQPVRHPVAEVAVALPMDHTFHYLVPVEMDQTAIPGMRVLAPFGRRQVTGYILRRLAMEELPPIEAALKPLIRPLDDAPLFGDSYISLIRFVSRYYHYPIGLAAAEALPAGLKVMSQRVVMITDAGKEALENGRPEETARRILEQASSPGGFAFARMTDTNGSLQAAVRGLEKAGLVVLTDRLSRDRVRSQMQKWLVRLPAAESSAARLGARETELLGLLKAQGPTPADDLRDRFPTLAAMMRRLAEKGRLRIEEKVVYRDDLGRAMTSVYQEVEPTREQADALAVLTSAIDSRHFAPVVLRGVTGSGKTEVYLRAARHALNGGRTVLLLVPEISLTPALEGLIRARFAEETAVMHSGLSEGERYDQWIKIRNGEARIVLGARSAVFAPLENLGLIVVDEEHDGAYKQEEKLRYQARDLAVWRAREAGAAVILGSATPSMETYYSARTGRYRLLELSRRVGHGVLPKVDVVDLRFDTGKRRRGVLTPMLLKVLEDTLQKGQQALLFINRRGTAGLPICQSCGHVIKCLNCSVSLTLHQRTACSCRTESHTPDHHETGILNCHHCGFEIDPPKTCPECKSRMVRYLGAGTEKLEAEVRKNFPDARVGRLDADTARAKGELRRILEDLRDGRLDILVGTQMITKGHDFPNITLVGVIEADLGLHLPDFRAGERTFQLLAQVGGRAGRGQDQGRVIVQTYSPDHYTLILARQHDYLRFYEEEIRQRRELQYPPFSRMALARLQGNSEQKTSEAASGAVQAGLRIIRDAELKNLEIMGPAPAPLAKVKGKYRFQILLRSPSVPTLHGFITEWLGCVRQDLKSRGASLVLDVDPYSMM